MAIEEEVLGFWFGDTEDVVVLAEQKGKLWWGASKRTDREIADRFTRDMIAAAAGELDDLASAPRGRLALIILLDQFSRNVYRGTPRAFAQDEKALALCTEGLDAGVDRELKPIERSFLYLPLEHCESLSVQLRSVRCYERLVEEAPDAGRRVFESHLDYARRHLRIIERFGRFPHRNEILGRESTQEERDFLLQPGSSF